MWKMYDWIPLNWNIPSPIEESTPTSNTMEPSLVYSAYRETCVGA